MMETHHLSLGHQTWQAFALERQAEAERNRLARPHIVARRERRREAVRAWWHGLTGGDAVAVQQEQVCCA